MARKKKKLHEFKSINERILETLELNNLSSLQVIAALDVMELVELLGITEAKASKIIEEAKENLVFEFESLKQVLSRRSKIVKLKTGSNNIDNLLDGGIETQSIFEIYGEFASGKTHLMHQLAVLALQGGDKGGLNCSVLYVDTEQTFREKKILHIAKLRGLAEEEIEKNLIHIRAKTSEEQSLIIEKVTANPSEVFEETDIKDHKPLRVIIIDSMISRLRSEFMGRGQLSERQQKLNHMLNLCLNFAIKTNGLVLITNQVTSDPAAMFFASPVKAAGGHVMSHAATYRLYIRKGRDRKRIVKIVDAPNSPTNETVVYLTGAGLVDTDADIFTETEEDDSVINKEELEQS